MHRSRSMLSGTCWRLSYLVRCLVVFFAMSAAERGSWDWIVRDCNWLDLQEVSVVMTETSLSSCCAVRECLFTAFPRHNKNSSSTRQLTAGLIPHRGNLPLGGLSGRLSPGSLRCRGPTLILYQYMHCLFKRMTFEVSVQRAQGQRWRRRASRAQNERGKKD